MSIAQPGYLYLPNQLTNFQQTDIGTEKNHNGVDEVNTTLVIEGSIALGSNARICPCCRSTTHVNGKVAITLKHLPFGHTKTKLRVTRNQYLCPQCSKSFEDPVLFKDEGHYITKPLRTFIIDLLATNQLTLRCISQLTGVHECIVRDIDKERLKELHTEDRNDDKLHFKTPNHPVRYIGIDEFSLHRPFRFATHITDLETGEVLYVASGKKKQVVYDFIEQMGDKFMKQVKAIACDMNAHYAQAFTSRYPHLTIVYDHFHIVKNFNENVVNKIRQDAYYDLCRAKKWEEAAMLRRSRYLLLANRSNLSDDKVTKLDQILASNKLLFTADIIKAKLSYAFTLGTTEETKNTVMSIIDLCKETKHPQFLWFGQLLQSHLQGIAAHGRYPISTGRIEGINNRIKTMRRMSYGFRDDEYLFLKIIDASHRKM